MEVERYIRADTTVSGLYNKKVTAKQYDTGRKIRIRLTNAGSDLPVASASSVYIGCKRPDGKSGGYAGEVLSDGSVSVPLDAWALAVPGILQVSVSVVGTNSKKVSSVTFLVDVQPAEYSGDDLSESSSTPLIDSVLSQVAEIHGEVVAEETERKAEDAKLHGEVTAEAAERNEEDQKLQGKINTLSFQASKRDDLLKILAKSHLKNEFETGGTPFSWIQQIVRAGVASTVFDIGDQISCHHERFGSLIWDVIGIDHDTPTDSTKTHSMTLQLHECITDFPFDGREAFYYSAGGLTAGTYNFTVGEHIYVPSDVGKTYQFTLAQPLPAGGQIVFGAAYNVSFDGTYISTYSSGSSTTAIETAQITSGTGGTNLGTINNAINGGLNAILRALLGSNNYGQSALRQYLNSNAAAGSVWTPKNNFDRPPTWAITTAGFLNGMDEDFLAAVGNVDKITALNTISDGGGSVTTSEKFFLLSRSEVYGGDVGGIAEGAAYSYYSGNSDLSAPGMGTDTNRIKYRGIARYWFLRTPVVSSSTSEMAVDQKGNVVGANTGGSIGIAPACCIV